MVRTASSGLSTFLESRLEKGRQSPEVEKVEGFTEGAEPARTPDSTGSRAVRRPPLRVSGFFGSGM